MGIYVTLTILTEHGNVSLHYLRAYLSLLMRFKTYNFGQIGIFLVLKKVQNISFHKSKYALTI